MRVTRGVLTALLTAAPSSLVLIGATAARTAFAGKPAYVASKHGLAGFARSVFLDVAAAVRWVVGTPPHVCPVEIDLQPQRTP